MAWISASIVLLLSVLLVVACKLRRRRPERESFPDYEVRYHSVRGSSRAHPHFVYDRSRGRGREKDVLKSVSITHDPHSVKGRSLRLWDNPRKGDRRKAYIPEADRAIHRQKQEKGDQEEGKVRHMKTAMRRQTDLCLPTCQTMAVSIIIDDGEPFINGRKEKGR